MGTFITVTERSPAGDTHNFGRSIRIQGDWVEKPRPVLWEWLLLAPASPLRRVLAELGGFEFLPSLRFQRPRAREGAKVERIRLVKLKTRTAHARRELAAVAGRATALFAWLGLADLHWENLVLGADAEGDTVFGPIDVEMIFDDLALPTETKLVAEAAPDDPELAIVLQHAAGLRRFLPWLGKPVDPGDLAALAAAYQDGIAMLDRHATAIAAAIRLVPGVEVTPIRVLLRGTDAYARAARGPIVPPLIAAEALQLARGDVPWFFRLIGEPGIFHFTDPALKTRTKLARGEAPPLPPLLSLAKGLRSPRRRKLREDGLVTLLAAFDHPELHGTHEAAGLALHFGPRRLTVALASGDELSIPRPFGVVSSLYQPCTCGETPEPLVPAVTRCVQRTARRGTAKP